MSKANRNFTVVVGVDLKESGGYALDQAAHIVQRIPRSELHVIHIADVKTPAAEAIALRGRLRLYVEEKVRGHLSGQSVGVHLRLGDPALEIVRLTNAITADLVLLGTHKPPLMKSLFVGSVAESVLGNVACPVFVTGPKPPVHEKLTIEPECEDCVKARLSTRGREWWCARHAEHHVRAHAYSYQEETPFDQHGSAVLESTANR